MEPRGNERQGRSRLWAHSLEYNQEHAEDSGEIHRHLGQNVHNMGRRLHYKGTHHTTLSPKKTLLEPSHTNHPQSLPAPQTTLNILTLSNSSTIRSALHTLLTTTPYPLTLTILESRPRFEGADMAAQLLASLEKDKNYAALSRLSISIDPDCTAAHHARSTHLLLLGADRISSSDGSVSNKIGSLPAALCVRHVNPRARVVVLTDTDKIVRPGAEEGPEEVHPASEVQAAWSEATKEKLFGYERMPGGGSSISSSSGGDARKEIGSYGGWFEWVLPELLDVYVTEAGVLDCKGVMRMGGRIQELEERIFGS